MTLTSVQSRSQELHSAWEELKKEKPALRIRDAAEALKVLYPARAIARLGDFQGNVKMHKYNDSRLHPDSKFAHGFRDNVKEERTLLMNMKLMWAKLFRKSETQPDNLKEKITKPKYDKREKGLWND